MQRGFSFLALSLCVTSCKSYEAGAKESFSEHHTCPLDRVEVRRRSDLKLSAFQGGMEAPADIKSDPGRLKMWEEKQEKSRESTDAACEMWEAKGCGFREFECCRRPAKHANRVSCFSHKPLPGMPEW